MPDATRIVDPGDGSPIDPEMQFGQTLLDAGRALEGEPDHDLHDAAVVQLVHELHASDDDYAEAVRVLHAAHDRRERRVRGALTSYRASLAGLGLPSMTYARMLRALTAACDTYQDDARARQEGR